MRYIADFHIHSNFSRATSRDLDLEHLNLWGQIKGIQVLGTGDFTHPAWFAELERKLREAEEGLYVLKMEYFTPIKGLVPRSCEALVRFVLSTEISNIYKKHGKTRKVHNLILVPDIKTAMRINHKIKRIGNLDSDGRPILGLDSKDLLEIVMEISENSILIPAHIWTPWFSVLGSNSGFDSLEECFDEYLPYIFAVETGLSSDPAMNWRLSALDKFTLVSNSDAHSPSKIGREANIFETELSFKAIRDAIKTRMGFSGTIEFFPEEGKYHFDGHRKCSIRMDPRETIASGGICPVCKTPVTIGVMNRVEQLADREKGMKPEGATPYISLLSLSEVLADIYKTRASSKRVQDEYRRLIERLGPELIVLIDREIEEIEREGGPLLSEGIRRMREGRVHIAPGYDGTFGEIHIFNDEDRELLSGQGLLLRTSEHLPSERTEFREERIEKAVKIKGVIEPSGISASMKKEPSIIEVLNPSQHEAVLHKGGALMIVAGPGTGKTRTLTRRIAFVLENGLARPHQVLALTFTRKAAQEMKERLSALLMDPVTKNSITVDTFHGISYRILRKEEERRYGKGSFVLVNEGDRLFILRSIAEDCKVDTGESNIRRLLHNISLAKQRLLSPSDIMEEDENLGNIYELYQKELESFNGIDLDDLIFRIVTLFEKDNDLLSRYRDRFPFLFVDEYQDINYAQYRFIRLLSPEGDGLCVIGDPDQAIYGFRGADRTFFMRFRDDYPGASIIHLHRSYRSTETILRTAINVIEGGAGGGERRYIWSGIEGHSKVSICELQDERAEAEFVASEIDRFVGGIDHRAIDKYIGKGHIGGAERSFGDFAVLYRINAMGRPLEEALSRAGIPFQLSGERPLVEQEGIREIVSCIGLLIEGRRESFLFQVLHNLPWPGVENDLIRGMVRKWRQRGWSVGKGMKALEGLLNSHLSGLDDAMNDPITCISTFMEKARGLSVRDQILMAIEVFRIDKYISDMAMEEKIIREERIRWLLDEASRFGHDLDGFLASLYLMTGVDIYNQKAEKVSLMTIHASKGLEFPVVFIVGCEDGIIPYMQAPGEKEVDEEKRLFYVGITRAMERLYLSHVKRRSLFGEIRNCQPSPFLYSIEDDLKETMCFIKEDKRGKGSRKKQLSLF